MQTKIKCTCASKKETQSFAIGNPINTCIELTIPYGADSIYYQMSGGTTMTLNTVNQDAANMFIVGDEYDILVSPAEKPVAEPS